MKGFKTFINAENLIDMLQSALLEQGHKAADLYEEPKNSRNYKCAMEHCNRPAYASMLCNAHYVRNKKGMDMYAPVRARKRNDKCEICGNKCGAKGGWGLCPKHYKSLRKEIIKNTIIDAMGGCCSKCKGVFHQSVYDFHHIKDSKKDFNPSEIILNKSLDMIAKEIEKCVLLCANCHRLEHYEK